MTQETGGRANQSMKVYIFFFFFAHRLRQCNNVLCCDEVEIFSVRKTRDAFNPHSCRSHRKNPYVTRRCLGLSQPKWVTESVSQDSISSSLKRGQLICSSNLIRLLTETNSIIEMQLLLRLKSPRRHGIITYQKVSSGYLCIFIITWVIWKSLVLLSHPGKSQVWSK